MSVVDFTAFFLNDAADPSDYIRIDYMPESYTIESTLGGGIDDGYASGRSRVWSADDDKTVVSLPFARLSASNVAWLLDHRGRVLCFRDPRGAKVFCAFHGLPVTYQTRSAGTAVDTSDVTLSSVTWSEAV